jgi:Spy/CpxP family protein refolding chaperone
MFGFFIGSACIAGLAMMAARRRFHGYGHGHGPWHRHGRGGFRRRVLYGILDRLDTTPGQEKVILAAIDDFRDGAREARRGLEDVRKDVAEAFRAEAFDEASFAALFDEPLRRLQTIRDSFAKTVGTVHEALTPKQRARVSDMLESTTRWGYGHAC